MPRTKKPALVIADAEWTGGLCSTFAARLQQRFGGVLWAVVNHSRKYPADDNLWHAYCVIDRVAYDANGPHTLEDASDTSETKWPIPEMDKNLDTVMVWRKVSVPWFARYHDGFDPADYPAVDAHLDRHPALFAVLRNKS